MLFLQPVQIFYNVLFISTKPFASLYWLEKIFFAYFLLIVSKQFLNFVYEDKLAILKYKYGCQLLVSSNLNYLEDKIDVICKMVSYSSFSFESLHARPPCCIFLLYYLAIMSGEIEWNWFSLQLIWSQLKSYLFLFFYEDIINANFYLSLYLSDNVIIHFSCPRTLLYSVTYLCCLWSLLWKELFHPDSFWIPIYIWKKKKLLYKLENKIEFWMYVFYSLMSWIFIQCIVTIK